MPALIAEVAEGDEGGGQVEQREVHEGVALVAPGETAIAVEPGEEAFGLPAFAGQLGPHQGWPVPLAAERGVTFDVCPISNVGLQVVPAMAAHPLRRLMAAGVRCTVSTDDPLCFANTLTEEYATLAAELAFTRAELPQLARNGWEVADVPADVRARMMAEIGRIAAGD